MRNQTKTRIFKTVSWSPSLAPLFRDFFLKNNKSHQLTGSWQCDPPVVRSAAPDKRRSVRKTFGFSDCSCDEKVHASFHPCFVYFVHVKHPFRGRGGTLFSWQSWALWGRIASYFPAQRRRLFSAMAAPFEAPDTNPSPLPLLGVGGR